MSADGGMMLVFRLGGVGFVLSVEQLIEVRETARGWLDTSQADVTAGVAGHIPHRGQVVPLRNLARRLGISGDTAFGEVLHLLVLVGADGPWCIAVDRVEGVFSAHDFILLETPSLPFVEDLWPFSQFAIYHGEPLLFVDPLDLEWRWRMA